eukprot:CAMPEP_0185020902 /NCGR_PEP_ID=MMETSP1103-20130426/3547_1 /TAXON_ID=36769 /ORGANISM="Paraphysomonas bandaiensis, Strain Caron Lab Isolate" /LENGTH=469 /DNA_ID=CAMNT_0027552089 /DNA_START=247 /DNA_END=1656 /DNA_ORIENTATION=-
MAVESIQTFHQQQQALYDEFLILRQKYDDQKSAHITTLWTHCSSHHPELCMIPQQESKEFVETSTTVGRYVVTDVLGEGQFATVYTCHTKSIPGDLAIKVIKKERITSFSSLRRVSNEIDILKKLNSKFIVRIIDVIHTKTKLYIVTEKGGQDLFEFFDEHPEGVKESWALEITTGILEAVLFCHTNFVCHRDLKPENILLRFDHESERCVDIKLCDFGLSTRYVSDVTLSDFCGSPGFFAPEMIMAGSYHGDKVDIWSVGCILLELVLGHERFCDIWMGCYDYEIMQDKEKFGSEIITTTKNLPNVLYFSQALNDFIIAILKHDPAARPVARDICKLDWVGEKFADLPPELTVPSMAEDVSKSSRKVVDSPVPSKNLLKSAIMSNRERHLMQEYAHKGGQAHKGEVNLPPIEPSTPSLGKARKIMKKGDHLVRKAVSNNYDDKGSSTDAASGDADEEIENGASVLSPV